MDPLRLLALFCSMSSALAITVKEFAARACVQRALQSPEKAESVLSFFFGVDYRNPDELRTQMNEGTCFEVMAPLWYSGGPEYDKLCEAFKETIRSARELPKDTELLSEADHVAAQLILADQLSRNAFRGTPEAFAYTDLGLESCRKLANPSALEGTVYYPYSSFAMTAACHSEDIEDHVRAQNMLKQVAEDAEGNEGLQKFFKMQKDSLDEHKAVVDRFGRYPHRNKLKGRESTPEEEAWLADVDNLPGWAKSQLSH